MVKSDIAGKRCGAVVRVGAAETAMELLGSALWRVDGVLLHAAESWRGVVSDIDPSHCHVTPGAEPRAVGESGNNGECAVA